LKHSQNPAHRRLGTIYTVEIAGADLEDSGFLRRLHPLSNIWNKTGIGSILYILVRGEASWRLMGLTAAAGLLVLALGFAGKKVFGKARPVGLKAS